MKVREARLIRIGNDRALRLPAGMIERHRLEEGILVEEEGDRIILRGKGSGGKLSWEETARQMAAADEGWQEWEGTAGDGLEGCVWDAPRQGEAPNPTKKQGRRRKARGARIQDSRE